MSVYVDPLINWNNPAAPKCFRGKPSCHMYADSLEELHIFARKIGLKRSWFQNHKIMPHYDLTASRRAAAVLAGAIEKDWRHMVKLRKRIGGPCNDARGAIDAARKEEHEQEKGD